MREHHLVTANLPRERSKLFASCHLGWEVTDVTDGAELCPRRAVLDRGPALDMVTIGGRTVPCNTRRTWCRDRGLVEDQCSHRGTGRWRNTINMFFICTEYSLSG